MNDKRKLVRVDPDLVPVLKRDLSAPFPLERGNSFWVDAEQFAMWREWSEINASARAKEGES